MAISPAQDYYHACRGVAEVTSVPEQSMRREFRLLMCDMPDSTGME